MQWRQLLDDCAKRKVDPVLVWRLDRAFRSVLDAAQTLERLRTWGAGLRSYQEPWLDITSPFGEAQYYITVAHAQLERGILRESVVADMARARRRGKSCLPRSGDGPSGVRRAVGDSTGGPGGQAYQSVGGGTAAGLRVCNAAENIRGCGPRRRHLITQVAPLDRPSPSVDPERPSEGLQVA